MLPDVCILTSVDLLQENIQRLVGHGFEIQSHRGDHSVEFLHDAQVSHTL